MCYRLETHQLERKQSEGPGGIIWSWMIVAHQCDAVMKKIFVIPGHTKVLPGQTD